MNRHRAMPPDEVVWNIVKDSEQAKLALGVLQARYHDLGQTHWMGSDSYDTPHPTMDEAHRLWRLAYKALEHAEHVLIMTSIGSEPAPTPDELCKETR